MKRPTRLPRFLEVATIQQLIAEAKGEPQLLLHVLWASGARIGELCGEEGIIWGDLDLGEQPSIRLQSKGGDERLVPLYPECAEALRAAKNGHGYDDRVFSLTTQKARDQLASLGRKHGVPGLHPHMIRHSFATHLLNGGADLLTVSYLLAHQSVDTTALYWHQTDPRLQALRRCIATCLPREMRHIMAHPGRWDDIQIEQLDP